MFCDIVTSFVDIGMFVKSIIVIGISSLTFHVEFIFDSSWYEAPVLNNVNEIFIYLNIFIIAAFELALAALMLLALTNEFDLESLSVQYTCLIFSKRRLCNNSPIIAKNETTFSQIMNAG